MGVTTTTNLSLNKPDLNEPMPNWPAQNTSDCNTIDALLDISNGTYTPTLAAVTTNPTLGNSTISGHWFRPSPNFIIVWIHLVIGSTFVAGSGSYRFGLPFDPDPLHLASGTIGAGHILGKASFRDADIVDSQTGVVQLRSSAVPDVFVTSEQGRDPWDETLTPTASDRFVLQCAYVTV